MSFLRMELVIVDAASKASWTNTQVSLNSLYGLISTKYKYNYELCFSAQEFTVQKKSISYRILYHRQEYQSIRMYSNL
jgi:hypothetical protein